MRVLSDAQNKNKKDTDDKPDKPKPQVTDSESLNRRKRLVRETIDDFAQFVSTAKGETTSDPGSLSKIIENNADDLAFGVAAIAEKITGLGVIIDRICGRGGILSIARSFSSVGRWLIFRLREGRARRDSFIGTTPAGEKVWTDADGYAALDDGTRLEQGSVIHTPDGETVVVEAA